MGVSYKFQQGIIISEHLMSIGPSSFPLLRLGSYNPVLVYDMQGSMYSAESRFGEGGGIIGINYL